MLFEVLFWLAFIGVFLVRSNQEIDDLLTVPFGRYNLPYLPLLLSGIIVCAPYTSLAKKLLESAPLKQLGTISYGVYIYHLPCLKGVSRFMTFIHADISVYWYLLAILALFLTITISTVSYFFMERPIYRWVRRF